MAKKKPIPQQSKQPQAKSPVPQKKPVQPLRPEAKTLPEKWLLLILVGAALLVNINTVTYDYTLDDPYFTTAHPYVRQGLSQIPEFFTHAAYYGVYKNHDASYRPLLLLSFALEKQLFGFDPHVSHAINLLLFAALIVALFLMLRRMFNTYSVYIPFFIALLFALHPIHTEVIASVKSRDELLAFLFSAICMLQSLRYIDTQKKKYLFLTGIFFFLALMSKETPITFVVIVPMTIYFFRDTNPKQLFTTLIPYLAVAAVYMLMRASFIENDSTKVRILVNNNALMAASNYADKLATALFIQLKYLILLVFPHPLSYDYSYNQIPIIGFGNVKALAALVILAGLVIYAVINLKKKDVYAYSILFYFGSAFLTANILIDIGATMAERFVFTASLGYCIALVFLIARFLKEDVTNLNYARSSAMFIVIICISVLYSVKTFSRNGAWKDNLTLYESGMETAPNSWRAQYLLGVEYAKRINNETTPQGKKEMFAKAIEHLNASSNILPSEDVYLIKGLTFDMIGGTYDDSALAAYKAVLVTDPDNQKAATGIGGIYMRHNDFQDAITVLSKVVAKDSTYTDALTNLGAAYGNSGHYQEALVYYNKVMRINPDQPIYVYTSMSNLYKFLGDSANAQHYRQLLYEKEKQK